ncbi:unnamed protein product [Prunus armeniaca]|uniref:Protein kinase domain-containing protein n=1 Tax=Prunus armeniaca TaxID=36596 RepID=A0A6J5VYG3_PRUAR|nr:unnamed protein product [Prunus armeniaca]
MALIRQRRQLNLRLPLPEPSECHPCFSVPLPPTAAVTTAVTNNSSFGTISAVDLEKLQVLGHGNSGTVYKVNHKRASTTYALKLVYGDSNDHTVRRGAPTLPTSSAATLSLRSRREILASSWSTWTPAPSRPCLKPKAPSPSPILPTSPAKFLTASTTSTTTRSSTATSNPPMFW